MDEERFYELISSINTLSRNQLVRLKNEVLTDKNTTPEKTFSDEELSMFSKVFQEN
ncbi:TPA: hypothetical protein ACPJZV_001486 [Vibrio diabolicus]